AALDAATGAVTHWNAHANGPIAALAVSGPTLYAAGWFSGIGIAMRRYIAALDVATGVASPWNPKANDYVFALSVDGAAVYAGGAFTKIGGQASNHVAVLDARTGEVVSWPGASGDVFAIHASGSTLYVGGDFREVGGLPHSNVAAVAALSVPAGGVDLPGLALEGVFPNPAPGVPAVYFTLRSTAAAKLDVLDIAGRRVMQRELGSLGPGRHVVTLDSSPPLDSGIYFLRLVQNRRVLYARMAIMR